MQHDYYYGWTKPHNQQSTHFWQVPPEETGLKPAYEAWQAAETAYQKIREQDDAAHDELLDEVRRDSSGTSPRIERLQAVSDALHVKEREANDVEQAERRKYANAYHKYWEGQTNRKPEGDGSAPSPKASRQ